ncbi:hypothetical protein FQN60_018352 [Etheostoma spectabile]|uniref:Uncharacterized protein n=1 Tax=Etheostoma spectabile TaxID=54343 RepID=A0A5J5DHS5_9PERO|nr:hypothetical protein FQN60_018352 [Etheostoma spectabile]
MRRRGRRYMLADLFGHSGLLLNVLLLNGNQRPKTSLHLEDGVNTHSLINSKWREWESEKREKTLRIDGAENTEGDVALKATEVQTPEAAVLTNYTLRFERHSEIIQVMSKQSSSPPLGPVSVALEGVILLGLERSYSTKTLQLEREMAREEREGRSRKRWMQLLVVIIGEQPRREKKSGRGHEGGNRGRDEGKLMAS